MKKMGLTPDARLLNRMLIKPTLRECELMANALGAHPVSIMRAAGLMPLGDKAYPNEPFDIPLRPVPNTYVTDREFRVRYSALFGIFQKWDNVPAFSFGIDFVEKTAAHISRLPLGLFPMGALTGIFIEDGDVGWETWVSATKDQICVITDDLVLGRPVYKLDFSGLVFSGELREDKEMQK